MNRIADNPIVDILLATYNGEKYIEEQIQSILNQTYANWKLIIRDDGSIDNTIHIIQKYITHYPEKIYLLKDNLKNIGTKQNFFVLMKNSTAEYIMFCDQDDIWLPYKIELTLNRLKYFEHRYGYIPLAIFTDLKIVEQNLNIINESLWKFQNINPNNKNINMIIVSNVATGCTMMINKVLNDLVAMIPDEANMHDWWIALIASAFGKLEYLNEPTVLYRQHFSNSVGAFIHQKTPFKFIYRKVLFLSEFKVGKEKFSKEIYSSKKQTKIFFDLFKNKLDKKNYKIVKEYIDLENNSFLVKKYKILKYRYFQTDKIKNLKMFFYS